MLKSIFFSLFVFTIGYKSGPEFFASLSLRTLSQVGVAVVVSATGLALVLLFASVFHLDPGTASGLASGSLTQSSMIGTATGALALLGLPDDVLRQQQANIAAGYAVTYVLGYILTLLFVPFVAPWLMGIDLKKEAAKLEAALSGGKARKPGSLTYQKFKARAYRVVAAAGQTVGAVEDRIGHRVVVERIDRGGSDVDCSRTAVLESGDEIVLAGPATALVRAGASIGPEIEGAEILREVLGDVLGVLVSNQALHGRTLAEIVDRVGDRRAGRISAGADAQRTGSASNPRHENLYRRRHDAGRRNTRRRTRRSESRPGAALWRSDRYCLPRSRNCGRPADRIA